MYVIVIIISLLSIQFLITLKESEIACSCSPFQCGMDFRPPIGVLEVLRRFEV
jgi:hypothetical protein